MQGGAGQCRAVQGRACTCQNPSTTHGIQHSPKFIPILSNFTRMFVVPTRSYTFRDNKKHCTKHSTCHIQCAFDIADWVSYSVLCQDAFGVDLAARVAICWCALGLPRGEGKFGTMTAGWEQKEGWGNA